LGRIGILNVGSEGEQFIQRELYNCFPPTRIARNVYLKKKNGEYTEIDILAVEHCGIFVFESKNFNGMIFGSEDDKDWTQVQKGTKRQFYNPIMQNNAHIGALRQSLQDFPEIIYYNFVVFSGTGKLNINPIAHPYTYVVSLDELRPIITAISDNETYKNNIPSASMRREIMERLSKTSHPSKSIRDEHLAQVQQIALKCPRCGSELVERTNRTSGQKFYGCKKFPVCRYTK
jgi:predicted RNA-binding Zn-ribbon protein involved in translation (DUF1610 family)